MEYVPACFFALLMVLAGIGDVLSRRIPNALTLSIALSFCPVAMLAGTGWALIGWSVSMALLVLIINVVLFHLGLFGGGDAKLLAAAALWFGTSGLAPFLVMTALAGGALALSIIVKPLFSGELRPKASVTQSVPYGFAIAVGAILAAPAAWWGPSVSFWSLLTAH